VLARRAIPGNGERNMFNISGVELAVILLAALLLLGPQRLPELARGLGKFLREFRRQTDDVRTMVEREFYQMDQEIQKVGETVSSSVTETLDKPGVAAPEALPPASSTASAETILPPSPVETEALPNSGPSGVTGEMYDAEYHAAEANGLIPSTEAHSDTARGASASEESSAAAAHQSANPEPPSDISHQEPSSRAK
jgi:sec-independent protein translocase protein TatB